MQGRSTSKSRTIYLSSVAWQTGNAAARPARRTAFALSYRSNRKRENMLTKFMQTVIAAALVFMFFQVKANVWPKQTLADTRGVNVPKIRVVNCLGVSDLFGQPNSFLFPR